MIGQQHTYMVYQGLPRTVLQSRIFLLNSIVIVACVDCLSNGEIEDKDDRLNFLDGVTRPENSNMRG
jgi:hypothetical protein